MLYQVAAVFTPTDYVILSVDGASILFVKDSSD